MRNLLTAVMIILPLLSFGPGCGKGLRETEIGPANADKKIMIAVYPSEYKNRVAQGLADRYRNRSKVTVVSLRKLNSVEYRNYDALVIIDALMAWQMFNVDSNWFVGKIREPEALKKIVLYLTAGDPKEKYKFQGIDCITGASVMDKEGEAIDKISGKVDALLRKQ
jgi:hypothetical protein